MKKLILFTVLLFSAQFAFADLAGDLTGIDVTDTAAIDAAIAANPGLTADQVAAALLAAGVDDATADLVMTTAGYDGTAILAAITTAYNIDAATHIANVTSLSTRTGIAQTSFAGASSSGGGGVAVSGA